MSGNVASVDDCLAMRIHLAKIFRRIHEFSSVGSALVLSIVSAKTLAQSARAHLVHGLKLQHKSHVFPLRKVN